jgi:hypothetical protein
MRGGSNISLTGHTKTRLAFWFSVLRCMIRALKSNSSEIFGMLFQNLFGENSLTVNQEFKPLWHTHKKTVIQ